MAKPVPPRCSFEEDPPPPSRLFAFIDANIILEGKPMEELPWEEVDPNGPIVALITSQVIQEVDSKKRDGRLGMIARAFNRKLGDLAKGARPIVIREASPRVELALSKPGRIPWDDYDELDPQDGDARIVAEALHARGLDDGERIVVSHDIKPIAYATGRDLRAIHVSDDWLRPPEPSPNEKAIQRLKQQVRELQLTEPAFEIEIEYLADNPAELYRVSALSSAQSDMLRARILAKAPRQRRNSMLPAYDYDSSFDRRFRTYSEEKLPHFLSQYAAKMELQYNQRPIRITVSNTGAVRADNLVVEITSSGGWLHDRVVFVAPTGPPPPTPQMGSPFIPRLGTAPIAMRAGRHDVEFAEGPDRSDRLVVHCEDFRHGTEWIFQGVVGLEVRSAEPVTIFVRVTASNMHGARELTAVIRKNIVDKEVADLVDLQEGQYVAPFHMQDEFMRLIEARDFDAIDSTGAGERDDYDGDY